MRIVIAAVLCSLSGISAMAQDFASVMTRPASTQTSAPTPTSYGQGNETLLSIHAYGFNPQVSGVTISGGVNSLRYISGSSQRSAPYLVSEVDLEHGTAVTSLALSACNTDLEGTGRAQLFQCKPAGGECLVIAEAVAEPSSGCAITRVNLAEPAIVNLTDSNYFLGYTQSLPVDTIAFDAVRVYTKRRVSDPPAVATFADVPTTHPFYKAIEALAASGITVGCGNGNFCPDAFVPRKQMAAFLAGALGLHHVP